MDTPDPHWSETEMDHGEMQELSFDDVPWGAGDEVLAMFMGMEGTSLAFDITRQKDDGTTFSEEVIDKSSRTCALWMMSRAFQYWREHNRPARHARVLLTVVVDGDGA